MRITPLEVGMKKTITAARSTVMLIRPATPANNSGRRRANCATGLPLGVAWSGWLRAGAGVLSGDAAFIAAGDFGVGSFTAGMACVTLAVSLAAERSIA